MARRPAIRVALALTLAAAIAAPALAQSTPAAPPRKAARARPAEPPKRLTVEQQLVFLANAAIVVSRPIGKGTTGALRVTLSDGTVTHDAAFNSVAEQPRLDGRKRLGEIRFVDHYRYNIAAWRLAVLLGLGPMMPATVERSVNGRKGALSWWVDDILMDEGEREARDIQPTNGRHFSEDRFRMLLFAELVRDIDRNKGNVVYTTDWSVVMIDFTRAFRLETTLRPAGLVTRCDRRLLAKMRTLRQEALEDAVEDYLTGDEIRAVMTRRDLLVAHFDALIAERGESVVLF